MTRHLILFRDEQEYAQALTLARANPHEHHMLLAIREQAPYVSDAFQDRECVARWDEALIHRFLSPTFWSDHYRELDELIRGMTTEPAAFRFEIVYELGTQWLNYAHAFDLLFQQEHIATLRIGRTASPLTEILERVCAARGVTRLDWC